MSKTISRHRFLVTAVSTALVATTLVPFNGQAMSASEKGFGDVQKGSVYLDAVTYLAAKGMINGYLDGTFKPYREVTRAHVATIIAASMNLKGSKAKNPGFSDVKQENWYFDAVAALAEIGVMHGDENGKFHPNDSMTRAEFSKVLSFAYGLKENKESAKKFTDVPGNAWYSGYVGALIDNQLTYGKTKNLFGSNQYLTRGQIALFVHRAELAKHANKSFIVEKVSDQQVTINGVSYKVAPSLAGIFSSSNDKALKHAAIKFTETKGVITAVTSLELKTSGTHNSLVHLDAQGDMLPGDLKVSGDYVSIDNLAVTGNLVIGTQLKNRLVTNRLVVEGKTIISAPEVSVASLDKVYKSLTKTISSEEVTKSISQNNAHISFENSNLYEVELNRANVFIEATGSSYFHVVKLSANSTLTAAPSCTVHKLTLQNDAEFVEINGSIKEVHLMNHNDISLSGKVQIALLHIHTNGISRVINVDFEGKVDQLDAKDNQAKLNLKQYTKIGNLLILEGTQVRDLVQKYDLVKWYIERINGQLNPDTIIFPSPPSRPTPPTGLQTAIEAANTAIANAGIALEDYTAANGVSTDPSYVHVETKLNELKTALSATPKVRGVIEQSTAAVNVAVARLRLFLKMNDAIELVNGATVGTATGQFSQDTLDLFNEAVTAAEAAYFEEDSLQALNDVILALTTSISQFKNSAVPPFSLELVSNEALYFSSDESVSQDLIIFANSFDMLNTPVDDTINTANQIVSSSKFSHNKRNIKEFIEIRRGNESQEFQYNSSTNSFNVLNSSRTIVGNLSITSASNQVEVSSSDFPISGVNIHPKPWEIDLTNAGLVFTLTENENMVATSTMPILFAETDLVKAINVAKDVKSRAIVELETHLFVIGLSTDEAYVNVEAKLIELEAALSASPKVKSDLEAKTASLRTAVSALQEETNKKIQEVVATANLAVNNALLAQEDHLNVNGMSTDEAYVNVKTILERMEAALGESIIVKNDLEDVTISLNTAVNMLQEETYKLYTNLQEVIGVANVAIEHAEGALVTYIHPNGLSPVEASDVETKLNELKTALSASPKMKEEIEQATAILNDAVARLRLLGEMNFANKLLEGAIVGMAPGQFSQESLNLLNDSIIVAAIAYSEEDSLQALNDAISALTTSISQFEDSVVHVVVPTFTLDLVLGESLTISHDVIIVDDTETSNGITKRNIKELIQIRRDNESQEFQYNSSNNSFDVLNSSGNTVGNLSITSTSNQIEIGKGLDVETPVGPILIKGVNLHPLPFGDNPTEPELVFTLTENEIIVATVTLPIIVN